jgi:hypothetical protein
MAVKTCSVSFRGVRGIRHVVEVEAESLYEAAVLAVQRFRKDVWTEAIGPATMLDVTAREPETTHSISLQQLERWLDGATSSPREAVKKAKLKVMLVQR